jgi:hypothetical protein
VVVRQRRSHFGRLGASVAAAIFGRRAAVGLAVAVLGTLLAALGDNLAGPADFSLGRGEPLVPLPAAYSAFYTFASRHLRAGPA